MENSNSVRPPLACRIPIASLNTRVSILKSDSVQTVSSLAIASGRPFVWIEGFSGAGKSSFGAHLALSMNWPVIELDKMLRDEQTDDMSYAERIDKESLSRAFIEHGCAQVILDGVCLRESVVPLPGMKRGDAFVVYIAKVSRILVDELIWHDGCWMEEADDVLGWLLRETVRYHRLVHPYADADRILLRVE